MSRIKKAHAFWVLVMLVGGCYEPTDGSDLEPFEDDVSPSHAESRNVLNNSPTWSTLSNDSKHFEPESRP